VACRANFFSDIFGQAVTTVAAFAGTSRVLFSFDAAVASSAVRNAPYSGFASVTTSGLNFGLTDHTASVVVEAAVCGTTMWSSLTAATCHTRAMYEENRLASVTVGVQLGTTRTTFSFDGAVVSHMWSKNAPIAGAGLVTVAGLDFAVLDFTTSAALSTSETCGTTSW